MRSGALAVPLQPFDLEPLGRISHAVCRALKALPPVSETLRLTDAEMRALVGAEVPDQPVPPPDAIPRLIDQTLLRPDAEPEEVAELCAEAVRFGFASVCVNPRFVPLAAGMLCGTGVRVASVVGFPLGASATLIKCLEAEMAIEQGARELDMVMAIGALKGGELEETGQDIAAVVAVGHAHHTIVKVIIETALLSPEEQVKAYLIVRRAGADFIKTSTGYTFPARWNATSAACARWLPPGWASRPRAASAHGRIWSGWCARGRLESARAQARRS